MNGRRFFAVHVLAASFLAGCVSTPLPPMPPIAAQQPRVPREVAPMSSPPVVQAMPVAPVAPVTSSNSRPSFIAPTQGPRISRFNGDTNKGVAFAGRMGDPVVASRAGRVVLLSSALASYGTMLVIKHDDDFITAYAHIDRALVKEGDEVAQGQPIAEMGRSGNNRVELHFEIRKTGVAVDPEPYLDGRAR